VYAGAMLFARVDEVIGDTNTKKYWYHTDQVGSVKAVTNQAGAVAWNADYLPFGTQYMKNKLDPDFEEDDLGFTGKGYDADTGLYYFNARWYDADTGRFISEDPVGDPSNPNLYTYGRNNPLSFNDPTGLESTNPGNVSTLTTGGGYGWNNGIGGVPTPSKGGPPTVTPGYQITKDKDGRELWTQGYYVNGTFYSMQQIQHMQQIQQGIELLNSLGLEKGGLIGGLIYQTLLNGILGLDSAGWMTNSPIGSGQRMLSALTSGLEMYSLFWNYIKCTPEERSQFIKAIKAQIGAELGNEYVEPFVNVWNNLIMNVNNLDKLTNEQQFELGRDVIRVGVMVYALIDGVIAAGRSISSRFISESTSKVVPNPYGKLGGLQHQGKILQIMQDIQARGLTPLREYRFDCGGHFRFADVVAVDSSGNVVEIYQVGRQLSSAPGVGVARERAAIQDIGTASNYNGAPITFVPYK
jgi:RHS repeat-associated protein